MKAKQRLKLYTKALKKIKEWSKIGVYNGMCSALNTSSIYYVDLSELPEFLDNMPCVSYSYWWPLNQAGVAHRVEYLNNCINKVKQEIYANRSIIRRIVDYCRGLD